MKHLSESITTNGKGQTDHFSDLPIDLLALIAKDLGQSVPKLNKRIKNKVTSNEFYNLFAPELFAKYMSIIIENTQELQKLILEQSQMSQNNNYSYTDITYEARLKEVNKKLQRIKQLSNIINAEILSRSSMDRKKLYSYLKRGSDVNNYYDVIDSHIKDISLLIDIVKSKKEIDIRYYGSRDKIYLLQSDYISSYERSASNNERADYNWSYMAEAGKAIPLTLCLSAISGILTYLGAVIAASFITLSIGSMFAFTGIAMAATLAIGIIVGIGLYSYYQYKQNTFDKTLESTNKSDDDFIKEMTNLHDNLSTILEYNPNRILIASDSLTSIMEGIPSYTMILTRNTETATKGRHPYKILYREAGSDRLTQVELRDSSIKIINDVLQKFSGNLDELTTEQCSKIQDALKIEEYLINQVSGSDTHARANTIKNLLNSDKFKGTNSTGIIRVRNAINQNKNLSSKDLFSLINKEFAQRARLHDSTWGLFYNVKCNANVKSLYHLFDGEFDLHKVSDQKAFITLIETTSSFFEQQNQETNSIITARI